MLAGTARRVRRRALAVAGLLLLLVGLLAGCAGPAPRGPVFGAQGEDALGMPKAPRWHAFRFRMPRAADGEVNSYIDAMLADLLLSPVLDRHRDDIELWRFHRRWPEDAVGHQFSLLVFAQPAVVEQMWQAVDANPLQRALVADGFLSDWFVEPLGGRRGDDPAATSDPNWTPLLQREWPHFIMGVSRLWLGLVRQHADGHLGLDLHPRYVEVEAELNELWFAQANHALLHHLSALFGYQPLRTHRHGIMTF